MIKAIIFDYDGTIADTMPIIWECVEKLAKREKKKLKIKNPEQLKDKKPIEIMKNEFNISIWKVPKYIKIIQEMMLERNNKVKLFKGIKTLIQNLSKNYKVHILTSNSEENVRFVLENNKIEVESVNAGSHIFKKHKAIKKFLKKNKLKNDEVIYVGDEIRDVEACKKSKVYCVAVPWGFNSRKLLEEGNPDYIVNSPKEILDLVELIH